jgi:hypothetical protein
MKTKATPLLIPLPCFSANNPPARIPIALLENAVKARLESGRNVSGWTQGQSRSVKVSQTSVEKG